MLKRMMLGGCALALCALPALTTATQAQDVEKADGTKAEAQDAKTYEFAVTWKKDDVYTIVTTVAQTVSMTMTIPNQPQPVENNEETTSKSYVEITVLDVDEDGQLTKFRSNWHSGGETDEEGEVTTDAPNIGAVIEYTWDAEKETWTGEEHEDSTCDDKEQIAKLLTMQTHPALMMNVGMPSEPVAKGDTWEMSDADVEMMEKSFKDNVPPGSTITTENLETKMTFADVLDVEEEGEYYQVDMVMTFDIDMNVNGQSMKGAVESSGTVYYGADSAKPELSSSVMTMSMGMNQGGAAIDISIDVASESALVEGSAEDVKKQFEGDPEEGEGESEGGESEGGDADK